MIDKAGLGATGDALTGMSIIVGGKNTFGKTGEVKLPEWKYIIQNEESTGLPESVMMEITIHDMSQHYIAAFAKGEDILLKANLRNEGKDIPFTAALSGQVHEISSPFKEMDNAGRTFKIRLDNYIEKVAGEETVKWNCKKLHLEFGGDGNNLLSDYANNTL